MNTRHLIGSALLALLAGCGGGQSASYTAIVSFGDSLSDVGSYRTAGIAAVGGGQYTVNGGQLTPAPELNWTEWLAGVAELPPPCPARTGLEASGPLAALAENIADHPECFSYAQGGARVSAPVGPWNKALLAYEDPSGYLGQLTEPVAAQVEHHLQASGGKFSPRELVTVWAGANDLFMQLFQLQAAVAAGADAQAATQSAVQAMAVAGGELAVIVKDRVLGKGASRVVVLNVPDVGLTPFALAQTAETRMLISAMASAFNDGLSAALQGNSHVLLVDVFAASREQAADPAGWGLTDITTPACDLGKTIIPSALVCSTPATVIPGDVTNYQYADSVHPTPYGHLLIAALVYDAMEQAHWIKPLPQ